MESFAHIAMSSVGLLDGALASLAVMLPFAALCGTSFMAPSEVPLLDLTPPSLIPTPNVLLSAPLLGYSLMLRVGEAARSW